MQHALAAISIRKPGTPLRRRGTTAMSSAIRGAANATTISSSRLEPRDSAMDPLYRALAPKDGLVVDSRGAHQAKDRPTGKRLSFEPLQQVGLREAVVRVKPEPPSTSHRRQLTPAQ